MNLIYLIKKISLKIKYNLTSSKKQKRILNAILIYQSLAI